ncbi:membrane protein [[Haemophilus] ducreyi]|nr:porin [[Haemophilus] ducreyi]AKO43330.1 membrane protein [[Haemophilus] ducreyi]
MKKTLVALMVATFSISASAAVVYEADGTKIEFDGSLRLLAEKDKITTESKETEIKKNTSKYYIRGSYAETYRETLTTSYHDKKNKEMKKNYRNSGSRLGITATQDLDDGFYAFGRLEVRADKTNNENQFGRLYIKRAFAGLGQKDVGQLTFGRQLTIVDDSYQTDSYEFGIVPSYIASDGNSVIRYDYTGVDGLVFSANYNLSEKQNAKGEALDYKLKNAYGVGFTYQANLKNNKAFYLNTAYGRSNYDNTDKTQAQTKSTKAKHYRDGYQMALGYKIGNFKLVSDFGYAKKSRNEERIVKTTSLYAAPGLQYQITPVSKVYGNYLYERVKFNKEDVKNTSLFSMSSKSTSLNQKSHGFLLGADYQLHKHVLVFLEGKVVNKKYDDVVMQSEHRNTLFEKESYSFNAKNVDKVIGVGMRVFW